VPCTDCASSRPRYSSLLPHSSLARSRSLPRAWRSRLSKVRVSPDLLVYKIHPGQTSRVTPEEQHAGVPATIGRQPLPWCTERQQEHGRAAKTL